jgi:Fur family zinc uptake transcriptional regulator
MRPDTEKSLQLASDACRLGGSELTALRRAVLSLILEAETPPTAYQLLDRLRAARKKGVAPPTIYRALDFLVEQKLVHKLERLNAFVPCIEVGHGGDPAAFLICRVCETVEEVEDPTLVAALNHVAAERGFRMKRSTVEIEGICAACSDPSQGAA